MNFKRYKTYKRTMVTNFDNKNYFKTKVTWEFYKLRLLCHTDLKS